MKNTSIDRESGRLRIRAMAYELTDEELDQVSGGDCSTMKCIPPNETTTDSNGDRTNDDTDT